MIEIPLLPSPRIPDYDDGIIDKTDYDADSVYAFVYYQNISVGDTINFYWDNSEIGTHTVIEDDVESDLSIMFHIEQQVLTNGTHVASYKVTDAASNPSISLDLLVYVHKDEIAEKILPPNIIGGEDCCLSEDEINAYSGAIVHVPGSDSLVNNIGHSIVVKWIGFDESGVPVIGGDAQFIDIIDKINSNGFNWTVPSDTVLLSLNGGANVYYYIETGAERIYSEAINIGLGDCHDEIFNIILSTDKLEINADGQDAATISALVLDDNNSPVANARVQWSSTAGNINPTSSVTGPDGRANTSFTSLVSGIITVGGTLSSGQSDEIQISVIQVDSILISSLVTDKSTIVADGNDEAKMTCTVVTSSGVPVGEETVYWSCNLGVLENSQTLTEQDNGQSENTLTSQYTGKITVTAQLGNGSSKSIQIFAEETSQKELKIMGSRVTLNGYGRYRHPRIVALDANTLQPVTAEWKYADNTGITNGNSFHDFKPEQVLIVSAVGYEDVKVNISNIAGNGSFIDDGIGPGAFAAITNSGKIIAWGKDEYGGFIPAQAGIYDSLFQNSHSFTARNKTTNKLLAWGNTLQGGILPDDIKSRTDILTVRGGFASMAMIASSYPYVDTWGDIHDGVLEVPSSIESLNNIVMLSATSNSWVALDDTGHVHAWGSKATGGELPDSIADLDNIYNVIATEQAFAVLFGDGQVSAWGNENFGGDESALVGDTGISQVFSTGSAFAALFFDGRLRVWGDPSSGGSLPSGWDHLTNVVDVCSTYGAFAALLNNGTVIMWGSAEYGGDGASVENLLTDVVSLSATGAAFAALKADGSVIVWGDPRDGGDATFVSSDLYKILAIYGNTRAFSAIRSDDTVICWGSSDSGGDGAPVELNGQISYLLTN